MKFALFAGCQGVTGQGMHAYREAGYRGPPLAVQVCDYMAQVGKLVAHLRRKTAFCGL